MSWVSILRFIFLGSNNIISYEHYWSIYHIKVSCLEPFLRIILRLTFKRCRDVGRNLCSGMRWRLDTRKSTSPVRIFSFNFQSCRDTNIYVGLAGYKFLKSMVQNNFSLAMVCNSSLLLSSLHIIWPYEYIFILLEVSIGYFLQLYFRLNFKPQSCLFEDQLLHS